jgi:hypothetical protein
MPRQDGADFLGHTQLFDGLPPGALEAVAAMSTPRLVRAG